MSELVTILKVKLLNGCIGLSKIVKKKSVFTESIAEEWNTLLICCLFSSVWISVVSVALPPVLGTPTKF